MTAPSPDELRQALDALATPARIGSALARDPLSFPRRYLDPADQEVAALVAGMLAFGRVDLFMPVVEAVLTHADARGGPADLARTFHAEDAATLEPLFYRWVRGPDLSRLLSGLGLLLRKRPTLGAHVAELHDPGDATIAPTLTRTVDLLTAAIREASGFEGPMPRGTQAFLASPRQGSACKRWNMVLRWMVRKGEPDLGLWDLPTRQLVIPLDVHVLRLSRLLGLTRRSDASWRTAEEVTHALRKLDPHDPVRFDFALAHLGISGECTGSWNAAVCPACPLVGLCREARRGRQRRHH